MRTNGDLVEEILAKLACEKGVAIARDDPLLEAVFLNQAVLEHYLTEAIAPMKEAISSAVAQAQQDVREHAQAQAMYVEQVMLKDRERFVAEQKAALDALDERLQKRDAGLVTLMADVIAKAREQLGSQGVDVRAKSTGSASLMAGVLGVVVGVTGSLGGMWLMLHYGG